MLNVTATVDPASIFAKRGTDGLAQPLMARSDSRAAAMVCSMSSAV
jgi:hypothetical protein